MIKMEVICKTCGMIYTLKQGSLPLGMKCTCSNGKFQIKVPKEEVLQLKAQQSIQL